MSTRITSALVLAAVVATAGAASAQVDLGGAVRLLGGEIVRQAIEESSRPAPSVVRAAPSAQVTANIALQTGLAFFGWDVGAPDGVIGPRTRSAISEYQALLNDPVTGTPTDEQRALLAAAQARAEAGGPGVAPFALTHPLGLRGLLIVQRDEMRGVASPAPTIAAHGKLPLGAVPPNDTK